MRRQRSHQAAETRNHLMRRAFLFAGVGLTGLAGASPSLASNLAQAQSELRTRTFRYAEFKVLRGINVAGAEFGVRSAKAPGRAGWDYFYPSFAYLEAMAQRGHRVVRLPVVWERLQPVIGGELRGDAVSALIRAIRSASECDLFVILDVHNYGRFARSASSELVLNGGISPLDFAKTWHKLVVAFGNERNIVGWGLMNEPHNLPRTKERLSDRRRLHEPVTHSGAWYITTYVGGQAQIRLIRRQPMLARGAAAAGAGGFVNALSLDRRGLRVHDLRDNGANAIEWQIDGVQGIGRARIEIRDSVGRTFRGTYVRVARSISSMPRVQIPPGLRDDEQVTVSLHVQVDGKKLRTPIVVYPRGMYYGRLSQPESGWKACSRAAVAAIRATGDRRPIYVAGDQFGGAAGWSDKNGAPWIKDPVNQIIYEAHYYFDIDGSGAFVNTYEEIEKDAVARGYSDLAHRVRSELETFTRWLKMHGVRGFIGEVGWPEDSDGSRSFEAAGNVVYRLLQASGLGSTYWAAGANWISTYPLLSYWVSTGGQVRPRQQALLIEKFPSIRH